MTREYYIDRIRWILAYLGSELWKEEKDALKMTIKILEHDRDIWEQLKETITEIRDNNRYDHKDVTEMCHFLLNYMRVLEDKNAISN